MAHTLASTDASAVVLATPELTTVNGQVTTTSQQIAEHFGKTHKSVLRSIRNLGAEMPAETYQRNFAPIQIGVDLGMGRIRQDPAYRITRDGFALLAMGFTGKEALHWKLAYIEAFNRMESALLAPAAPIQAAQPALDYTRISPAQAQHLKELVQLVAESGKQGFGETWNRLHRKMKVNSYHELPASRFDDACQYLSGKMDDTSMAVLIQKHFPGAVLAAPEPAPSLTNRRWLISYDDNGREQVQALPFDAAVMNFEEFTSAVEEPGGWMLSNAQLAKLAAVSTKRLAGRFVHAASMTAIA